MGWWGRENRDLKLGRSPATSWYSRAGTKRSCMVKKDLPTSALP